MIKTSILAALFTYIGAFLISTPSLGNFLVDPPPPPKGPSLEETVDFIKKHQSKECRPKDTTMDYVELLDFDVKKENDDINISLSYIARDSNGNSTIKFGYEFQASEISLPYYGNAMNINKDDLAADCYEILINCASKSNCMNGTIYLPEEEGWSTVPGAGSGVPLLIPDNISMGKRLAEAVYHLLKLGGAKKGSWRD